MLDFSYYESGNNAFQLVEVEGSTLAENFEFVRMLRVPDNSIQPLSIESPSSTRWVFVSEKN
jgi:hypothetical protein